MAKLASTLGVVLSVLALYGCGPDCRLLCEEIEKADCEGNAASDAIDCEYRCKHEQDLVTNAECQAEYDTYLLCIDDLDNICDAFPEYCVEGEDCDDPKCDNELEELFECYTDYCTEHPRNNECEFGIGG
jgi:hypothetical protein